MSSKHSIDENILYDGVIATPRYVAFDDEGAGEGAGEGTGEGTGEGAGEGTGDPSKDDDSDFTPTQKAKVDKLLKEQAEKAKRAMAEVEAIKARNDLTDSQRKDLETRFETIQKELLTKEELFEKEKKKKEKQFNDTLESLTSERDSWKTRYTESQIIRAIKDASSANKAFDSDTIVAILRPNADLIEAVDEEGRGTGKYTEKIKFLDPEGKDGKPAELLLTASEAVKRMAELPKYHYLFEGRGTGGLGQNNGAGGKATSLKNLANDPAAYRKARKEGRI